MFLRVNRGSSAEPQDNALRKIVLSPRNGAPTAARIRATRGRRAPRIRSRPLPVQSRPDADDGLTLRVAQLSQRARSSWNRRAGRGGFVTIRFRFPTRSRRVLLAGIAALPCAFGYRRTHGNARPRADPLPRPRASLPARRCRSRLRRCGADVAGGAAHARGRRDRSRRSRTVAAKRKRNAVAA